MASNDALYMGFDLSTQQLKCVVVNSDLQHKYEARVDFDADFGQKYGIHKGVLTNPAESEVFAPTAMWLEAVDLVLYRMKEEEHLDFSRIRGVSGAGMQHGVVFWSKEAESLLKNLDAKKTLLEQMETGKTSAFAHEHSPNWQDASTQKQCDEFDEKLGSAEKLAEATGSNAHHRFSGPQIMRFRTKYPSHYANVSRISLVSSFLTSLFVGAFAPIDISDVTGMNLWDVKQKNWNDDLLALAAGSESGASDLRQKLGEVSEDGGASPGNISPYFSSRFGFPPTTKVILFTGDNPSTILALPLRAGDAMVSLGTSTTFLMSTNTYAPDPAYHFMNHPTTPGLYMFMLCYKNGGLAREQIRDQLTTSATHASSWETFNATALATSPLAMAERLGEMRLGLYFPRPEIVPNVSAGQWRYSYNPRTKQLRKLPNFPESTDARNIVESQMLSLRLRSQALVSAHPDPEKPGETLPPQPRRVYLVGGGSANPAIAKLCGEVLGSVDGVYKLDIGGNACALGSAYKAVWACEREPGQTFEDLIGKRWDEEQFVKRVADGYTPGVFEIYGEAVSVFRKMEKVCTDPEAGKMRKQLSGGVFMGHDYPSRKPTIDQFPPSIRE